jgi:hypothetical protein
VKNQVVYDLTQGLMEKLAVEAFEVAMVSVSLFTSYLSQLVFHIRSNLIHLYKISLYDESCYFVKK